MAGTGRCFVFKRDESRDGSESAADGGSMGSTGSGQHGAAGKKPLSADSKWQTRTVPTASKPKGMSLLQRVLNGEGSK